MSLFRSERDIEFIKRINQELIEKVIGEKVTYYAISKQFSEVNFYGESKEKVFEAPVEVYALIQWNDQDITTTEFGQDIIYSIEVSILYKHLEDIKLKPYEGDMVEYNGVKFEITSINKPSQIFGKAHENIGVVLSCTSVRESNFKVSVSGTVDQPNRTYPDEPNPVELGEFSYGDSVFPYSGSL